MDDNEYLLNLEELYNFYITKISISHKERDETTWGQGYSVTEWLLEEDMETRRNAIYIEQIIMENVQDALKEFWFREELRKSIAYYYDGNAPYKHRCSYAKIKIDLQNEGFALHSVELHIFPYIFDEFHHL